RFRLSAWTVPAMTLLDFTRENSSRGKGAIWVRWRGEVIMLLYFSKLRIFSAGFAYDLSPAALREAISVLRSARGGIERWIVPALEHNQASGSVKLGHPETHRIIGERLESAGDLPVAAPWKRERRRIQKVWERWRREHPDARVEPPAPWVL